MQIPQPDLRIVPRKKDQNNSRTGPGPNAKHHKKPPTTLWGPSTPQCPKKEHANQTNCGRSPKQIRVKKSSTAKRMILQHELRNCTNISRRSLSVLSVVLVESSRYHGPADSVRRVVSPSAQCSLHAVSKQLGTCGHRVATEVCRGIGASTEGDNFVSPSSEASSASIIQSTSRHG